MKIGVAVAPAEALPSAFVVWRGIKASMKKAAEFGYDGVELALASADDVDASLVKKMCKQYGLEISAISTGQVFASQGLYLTHQESKSRKKTISVLRGLIDLAQDIGTKRVNIGRVRGIVHENENKEIITARFITGIRELAEYADSIGVDILIEPVNRYEINVTTQVLNFGHDKMGY